MSEEICRRTTKIAEKRTRINKIESKDVEDKIQDEKSGKSAQEPENCSQDVETYLKSQKQVRKKMGLQRVKNRGKRKTWRLLGENPQKNEPRNG